MRHNLLRNQRQMGRLRFKNGLYRSSETRVLLWILVFSYMSSLAVPAQGILSGLEKSAETVDQASDIGKAAGTLENAEDTTKLESLNLDKPGK